MSITYRTHLDLIDHPNDCKAFNQLTEFELDDRTLSTSQKLLKALTLKITIIIEKSSNQTKNRYNEDVQYAIHD